MSALCYRGLLLLAITAVIIHTGDCIECFLCSWTPRDNRSDVCTKNNFRSELLRQLTCYHGCETVVQYDNNGVMEAFFRNCADSLIPDEENCKNHAGKDMKRNVCICDWNLCNGATHFRPHLLLLLPLLTIATQRLT